jgi:hypothetical protein
MKLLLATCRGSNGGGGGVGAIRELIGADRNKESNNKEKKKKKFSLSKHIDQLSVLEMKKAAAAAAPPQTANGSGLQAI